MARQKPSLPPRFFMTDEERRPDPLPSIGKLAPGTGVIFRHYGDEKRATLAKQAATLCGKRGLLLFIAGDPRLARDVGAAGVHLPAWSLEKPFRVKDLDPGWLITAAAHNPLEVKAAVQAGADALIIGPVFPTKSHPGARPLDIKGFADLAARTSLPVYALGGITEEKFKALAGIKNLAGFAGISGFGK